MANPVITLKGSDPLVITQGQPYVDPGASAVDDAGVDISSSIRVSPTVIDTSAMSSGIPVTYEVTDARGESASRTRMVKIDPAPTPAPAPAPVAPAVPVPSRLANARSVALRVLAALATVAFAALLVWVVYLIIQNFRGVSTNKVETGKFELGSNAAGAIQAVAKDFFGKENAAFELRLDSGRVSQPARQPVIVVSTTQPASQPAPQSVASPEVRHYGWIWHRSCPKETPPPPPPPVVKPKAPKPVPAPTFLSPERPCCRPETRVPTQYFRNESEVRGSAGQTVRRRTEVVE